MRQQRYALRGLEAGEPEGRGLFLGAGGAFNRDSAYPESALRGHFEVTLIRWPRRNSLPLSDLGCHALRLIIRSTVLRLATDWRDVIP